IVEAHGAQELGHRGRNSGLQPLSYATPARSIMPARKIAIVTGGNRGLGLEIAKQLMKADLFVVVGARDRAKCEHAMEALKATGPNAVAFPLDVNDTHSARRFVEEVDKQHGAPGVLVNNAGVYPEATDATVVDSPTSIWRETFETNLFGAVRM